MEEYQEVETVDMNTGEVTEKRIARIEPVQEWSLSRVVDQAQKVNSLLQTVMKDGQHYGKIPGCGDKPTLLKPGAEKLGVMFRLAPRYKIESRDLSNGHREYEVTCSLYHIHTQEFWGEGVGVCSTMESKYRYRSQQRTCPECGAEAIIKGKAEFGGGWLCYKRKGGCGAKWNDGDPAIEKQSVGKVENPDIADTYNTVKKMAKKRALVDATITATGASDIFTQDVEDFVDENNGYQPETRKPEPPSKTPTEGAQAGHTSTQGAKPDSSPHWAEKPNDEFARYAQETLTAQSMLPKTFIDNLVGDKGIRNPNKTVQVRAMLIKYFAYVVCEQKKEKFNEKVLEWSKKRGFDGFNYLELDNYQTLEEKDIKYAYDKGKEAFKQYLDNANGKAEPPESLTDLVASAGKPK